MRAAFRASVAISAPRPIISVSRINVLVAIQPRAGSLEVASITAISHAKKSPEVSGQALVPGLHSHLVAVDQ